MITPLAVARRLVRIEVPLMIAVSLGVYALSLNGVMLLLIRRQEAVNECTLREIRALGEEGEGFYIGMSALDSGRYTVGWGATGMIRACLEDSIKYSQERIAFGKPIAAFQLMQQKIAEAPVPMGIAIWAVHRGT